MPRCTIADLPRSHRPTFINSPRRRPPLPPARVLSDDSSSEDDDDELVIPSVPSRWGPIYNPFAGPGQPRHEPTTGPFSRSVASNGGSPSGVTLSRSHAMRVSVAGSLRRSGGTRARVDTAGGGVGEDGAQGGRRVRARLSREGQPRDPDGMDELNEMRNDGGEFLGYGSAMREGPRQRAQRAAAEERSTWPRVTAGR